MPAGKSIQKKFSNPDIKKILKMQREYFCSGKTLDISFRRDMLRRLKSAVLANEREIYEALKNDLNKGEFEAYMTEVGPVLNEINLAIRKLKKWARPERVPTPLALQPAVSRIYREPYGATLIIAPWNYPFNLIMVPLIGAIAAGNTAVLKTAPASQNMSELVKKIVAEAFEESYVAVFQGWNEVGAALLKERYDYIFFTGGTEFGKVVYKSAAEKLIPVTLELGGKSACIVADDADIDTTARRVVWGKFINCGQTCVAPDYILISSNIKEQFIEALDREIVNAYGEDPETSPDYGRIISDQHFKRLLKYMKCGRTVLGGFHNQKTRYISPTVIDDVKPDELIMKEEIFGPLLPLITVHSVDEAIDFVKHRPKPLALYVFTRSREISSRVLRETYSGGVCINDIMLHLGNEYLPFGGVGPSGIGAYHGERSFVTFSHEKSVLEKSFFLDIKLRYFPSSQRKLKAVRKIIS